MRRINNVCIIKVHKKNTEFLFYRCQGRCCCDNENERICDKGQWRKSFQESALRVGQIEVRKKHGDNRYHEKRKENFSLFIASFLESANVSFVLSIATTSDLFHQLFRRFILLLLLDSLSFSILLQRISKRVHTNHGAPSFTTS